MEADIRFKITVFGLSALSQSCCQRCYSPSERTARSGNFVTNVATGPRTIASCSDGLIPTLNDPHHDRQIGSATTGQFKNRQDHVHIFRSAATALLDLDQPRR